MTINTLIVDDEELARLLLKESLKEIPQINVVGEAENGFDALKLIADKKPQLIFLDVQMPKLTGLEMLELLDEKPEIIFITAFDQYALQAFEQNAVDYLLKPFTTKRLKDAIKRAEERLQSGEQSHQPIALQEKLRKGNDAIDRIVVKTGKKIRIIPVEEIHYLQAEDDYVSIHLDHEKHLKQKTMKYYESHLDPKDFVRIHRSYIVRIQFVDSIELYEKDSYIVKLKDGKTLPVSKSGYVKLRDSLRF
jgi:two-component system LytT family response regulator